MRSIKKVLVPVDGSALALARLGAAFNLAKSFDAIVTTLCVFPAPQPSIFSAGMHAGWFMGEEMLAHARNEIRTNADQVRLSCNQVAEQHGSEFVWRQVEGRFSDAIVSAARYQDLVVLGVPDTLNEPQLRDLGVDSALLSTGRPTLLIPGVNPAFETMPRNILFAWDGSRESLSALKDSDSFLEHAKSVMVVNVVAKQTLSDSATESIKDMVEYLTIHDVSATGHVLTAGEGQTIADVLIEYAHNSDCELIIQGAYGHSRFREQFLGGTTQDMLREATLPVLFSH